MQMILKLIWELARKKNSFHNYSAQFQLRILRGRKFYHVCDWSKRQPLIGLKKATLDPLPFQENLFQKYFGEFHYRILRGWKFDQVCHWSKTRPLIGLKKAT